LKATREGLDPAEVRIESLPVKIVEGLAIDPPQTLPGEAK
jgi:hypothetical protein